MKLLALLILIAFVTNLNATNSTIPTFLKFHNDTKISLNNDTILTGIDSGNSIDSKIPIIGDVNSASNIRNSVDSVYPDSNNITEKLDNFKSMAATKNMKKGSNIKSRKSNKKLSTQSDIMSNNVLNYPGKSKSQSNIRYWLEVLTQSHIVNTHMMNMENNPENEERMEKLRSLRDKLTLQLQNFLPSDHNPILIGSTRKSQSNGASRRTKLPLLDKK